MNTHSATTDANSHCEVPPTTGDMKDSKNSARSLSAGSKAMQPIEGKHTTKIEVSNNPVSYDPIIPTITKFTLFKKLPYMIRHRIWVFSMPSGRVVDVVYDKEQDRYMSFHAELPSILHTSQESRFVGLDRYTISFATKSHPAVIPFDFKRDRLMFDDWRAAFEFYPPGRENTPGRCPCLEELEGLIGPMGQTELNSIRRIVIPFRFGIMYGPFRFGLSIPALVKMFPALCTVNLTLEERFPTDKGPIRLRSTQRDLWCCKPCQSRIYTFLKFTRDILPQHLIQEGAGSTQTLKFSAKAVIRGQELQVFGIHEFWWRQHPSKEFKNRRWGEMDYDPSNEEEHLKDRCGDKICDFVAFNKSNRKTLGQRESQNQDEDSDDHFEYLKGGDAAMEDNEIYDLLEDERKHQQRFGYSEDCRLAVYESIYNVKFSEPVCDTEDLSSDGEIAS